MDEDSTWRNILLWKENIQESMKRIRQRLVRSGGSGRSKMGTNPDSTPPSKVQRPDALTVKGEVLVGECSGTWQLTT